MMVKNRMDAISRRNDTVFIAINYYRVNYHDLRFLDMKISILPKHNKI